MHAQVKHPRPAQAQQARLKECIFQLRAPMSSLITEDGRRPTATCTDPSKPAVHVAVMLDGLAKFVTVRLVTASGVVTAADTGPHRRGPTCSLRA